jgi:hypothetical protein
MEAGPTPLHTPRSPPVLPCRCCSPSSMRPWASCCQAGRRSCCTARCWPCWPWCASCWRARTRAPRPRWARPSVCCCPSCRSRRRSRRAQVRARLPLLDVLPCRNPGGGRPAAPGHRRRALSRVCVTRAPPPLKHTSSPPPSLPLTGLPQDPLASVRLPAQCHQLLAALLGATSLGRRAPALRTQLYSALLQFLNFARGSRPGDASPLVLQKLLSGLGPGAASAAQLDSAQTELDAGILALVLQHREELVGLLAQDALASSGPRGVAQAVALHLLAALVSADDSGQVSEAVFASGLPRSLLQGLPDATAALLSVSAHKLHAAGYVADAQLALLLRLAEAGAPRSAQQRQAAKALHELQALQHLASCRCAPAAAAAATLPSPRPLSWPGLCPPCSCSLSSLWDLRCCCTSRAAGPPPAPGPCLLASSPLAGPPPPPPCPPPCRALDYDVEEPGEVQRQQAGSLRERMHQLVPPVLRLVLSLVSAFPESAAVRADACRCAAVAWSQRLRHRAPPRSGQLWKLHARWAAVVARHACAAMRPGRWCCLARQQSSGPPRSQRGSRRRRPRRAPAPRPPAPARQVRGLPPAHGGAHHARGDGRRQQLVAAGGRRAAGGAAAGAAAQQAGADGRCGACARPGPGPPPPALRLAGVPAGNAAGGARPLLAAALPCCCAAASCRAARARPPRPPRSRPGASGVRQPARRHVPALAALRRAQRAQHEPAGAGPAAGGRRA